MTKQVAELVDVLPSLEAENESELQDAHAAFRRIAAMFGLEDKIACTPGGWSTLAAAVEEHVALLREPDFVKRAHTALAMQHKYTTPRERFDDMVRRGTICPQGCVILNGARDCDPERHK